LLKFIEIAFVQVLLLALCASAHAAPIGPDELIRGCSNLRNLRSANYNEPVLLNFMNKMKTSVHIIWIDYQGAPKLYRTLAPNQNFTQSTYVSHPWLITSAAGSCLGAFVASQSQKILIKEPDPAVDRNFRSM
jgi:von Hippel-Lindau disease tumor suppressor protein